MIQKLKTLGKLVIVAVVVFLFFPEMGSNNGGKDEST